MWPFVIREAKTPEKYLADQRVKRVTNRVVDRDSALRLSALWAALRLRADMVSTMPVDVYRKVDGVAVEVPKPAVLVSPDGAGYGLSDWLYRTQLDLDSCGNAFGLIEERDGSGRPSVIQLLDASKVVVGKRDGELFIRYGREEFPWNERIWHERQYPVSGSVLGLSPVAFAAYTMNPALSAAEFAADWFASGGTPAQHLRNTAKTLDAAEAQRVKDRYKSTVGSGDVFVSGSDWELSMLAAKASDVMFLDQQSATARDICRYVGVPGDMVDVDTATGSITYANITQRNLQFLTINLDPTLTRRERAFSNRLVAAPRYVKFNRGSLMRMDLVSRYQAHATGITNRFLTPNEARQLEDLPALTDEQVTQFATLFNPKSDTPQKGSET